MASRLRKQQIIPEDTPIKGILTDPKIVHGKFGRQVELVTKVTEGGEDNQYKGTTFKCWFSFGQDKETKEEYIAYGEPLYQLLSMVASNVEAVLEDEDLSNADYEKFLKKAVRELDDFEILARVGVKEKNDKKSNFLQYGTFGPYDEEADFNGLDMGDESAA
jgi:hypothetical protein